MQAGGSADRSSIASNVMSVAKEKKKKYFPPPAVSKSAPNKTNKKIKSTETPIGIPNIAS
jgi:hypothetical protein